MTTDESVVTQRVFVSYSHVDESLVVPLVSMMRAVGANVFVDVDSIPPGKRWRTVIEDSMDAASIVLVFWCLHAARSRECQREVSQALCAAKDIIPALLDPTPLDPRLAAYQYIDFKHATHQSVEPVKLQDHLSPQEAPAEPPEPHWTSVDQSVAEKMVSDVLDFLRRREGSR